MQISQDFIQKIKDNITISEFLHKYIQIIPAGNARYKALCPFHNEKTPSFLINDDKSSYHCFGCGAHGDAITFLMEKEGYNFADAVKYLANMAGLKLPEKLFDPKEKEKTNQDYEIFNEITDFFTKKLTENNLIQQYLDKRAINSKLIAEFNIGYAPTTKIMDDFIKEKGYAIDKLISLGIYRKVEHKQPYFLFYNRVIFPIRNHYGNIIAFGGRVINDVQPKYINSPEHEYFKKREVLFNWHKAQKLIKSSGEVIVCEGYMDVLALHKNGFTHAVAPLGTAFSEYHLKTLWQYCDKPVICLDGDVAGRRAMLKIANLALPFLTPGKSLAFNLLPEGLDPDDFLKQLNGKEKFQQKIIDSLPLEQILLHNILPQQESFSLEERSIITQSLYNYAHKINDKLVQKQYFQYFNQAIFKFFKNKQYSHKKITNNISLPQKNISIKELDLLLFLSNNIKILSDEAIEEEFSFIEFSHNEFNKLQSYLLENQEMFSKNNYLNWIQDNLTELKDLFLSKLEDAISNPTNLGWQFFYKSFLLEKLNKDRQNLNMLSQAEFDMAHELQKRIIELEAELQELLLD